MPLLRRIPKRGFNNTAFKKAWGIVNIGDLEQFDAGAVIDEALLRNVRLIRGLVYGVKLLGDGETSKALIIKLDAISDTAREKIEKAGGSVELSAKAEPVK